MSLQFPVRTGYVAFAAHWVVSLIIVFNNSTWIMRHMLVLFDCANTRLRTTTTRYVLAGLAARTNRPCRKTGFEEAGLTYRVIGRDPNFPVSM